MIRAIDHDYATPSAARTPLPRTTSTGFADMFASLATPAGLTGRSTPAASQPEERRTDGDREKTAKLDEALVAFKKELSMTPAERVRRDVLKSMDLTEEAIETLPPKERVAVEQKVAMEVARRMKVMQGGSAAAGPSTAGAALMLGQFDIRSG